MAHRGELDTARMDSERDGRAVSEAVNRVFRKRGAATCTQACPEHLQILGFGRGGEGARAQYGWSPAVLSRLSVTLGEAYRAELRARRSADPAGMLHAFGADLGHALRVLAGTGRVSHCEPPKAVPVADPDGDEEEAEED